MEERVGQRERIQGTTNGEEVGEREKMARWKK